MQTPIIIHFILLILGCLGLILSTYIYHCKAQKKPLICPMRGSCDAVTGSEYAKFFGCRVEVLGVTYYTAVILLNGAIAFYPAINNSLIAQTALAAAGISCLFSLYLIVVQAFFIKHWCTWCICSALLCASIFLTTFAGSPFGIM